DFPPIAVAAAIRVAASLRLHMIFTRVRIAASVCSQNFKLTIFPIAIFPYLWNNQTMDQAVVIGALAQENRLDIFRLLFAAGASGPSAGAIASKLDLPSPTLSFHLAQLKHAGLVSCRRESRSLIYAANYPVMNGLLAYLTENCCGGQPAACGITVCKPDASNRGTARGEPIHEAPARLSRR